jgi:hypothetical protein
MNQETVQLSMSHLAKWIVGLTVTILLSAPAYGATGDASEGKGLVDGGQFMDRFLPMPVQGKLTSETWGADRVKPRYVDNGIEESEWSYWGGQARLAADGKYHLYVARWRKDSPRGHMEWGRSFVAHAVADKPLGPYRVQDTLGRGHNPEVFQLKDGRYVVYVIGGYYIAHGVDGPWEYRKFEFNPRGRRIIEGLSNLAFARREDGSFLMVCRGGGIWFSKTGISPYNQVTDQRIYPPVKGAFEDPVVWRTNIQYHLIVNDWRGRSAFYLRSKDGINWKVEPGTAYRPGIAVYADGTKVDWYKYERPKVLQDEYGRATQMHFAVIDVVKRQDKGNDDHSSKHICIPLTVGRLLTLLDKEPINSATQTIRVKIAAEEDFNPHTDIDVDALRFGAPEEVHFGRGCKARKTECAGDDLIVTFEGAGNGITEDNFTAKLLGKTSSGKLLFGYARLPWLNYLEAVLSASPPSIAKKGDDFMIAVEVQNFGQVASKPAPLKVVCNTDGREVEAASGTLPALDPFEKTVVELTCGNIFKPGVAYATRVIIHPDGQHPVVLQRSLHLAKEPK